MVRFAQLGAISSEPMPNPLILVWGRQAVTGRWEERVERAGQAGHGGLDFVIDDDHGLSRDARFGRGFLGLLLEFVAREPIAHGSGPRPTPTSL